MFKVNEDLSIYATRGDIVFFSVTADDHGVLYKFQPGDIVRMAIYGKKDAENCVMQKEFPVTEVTEKVFIYLEEEDTKIGESISKPKDYWYEVVLNPDTMPQTIIGYDDDGAKVFKLFPESEEIDDNYDPQPEDFPVVDEELDMTSPRPVSNSAIARAVATLLDTCERTNAAVAEKFVTPQMFGALGDGKSDDTDALQEALLRGKNVHLPEGVFVVNEPLFVNANTTNLVGESSKSVIKAGDKFPEGESVITFYSPAGDYNNRRERVRIHGNFSVIGRDKLCHGVRIGGAVGTDMEGHVEASIFQNIMVDDCDVAFLWGAHAYKNTLFQCDSHDNNYSLKTSEDITDAGEVVTCINCGFWSGVLHIADCGELMLYGCTIHTKAHQTADGVECGHYFKNAMVTFQNCHFETVARTAEECDEVRPSTFYANDALVYMNECMAVVTGNYVTLNAPMFVDASTSGVSHGIFINGGSWKYYLARVKLSQLTSGHVQFTNVLMKYIYDGITLPYKIYDHTKPLTVNKKGGFDYYYGIADDVLKGITIKETADGEGGKVFTVTAPAWFDTPAIGFYRKVDVSGWKTCKLLGAYTHDRNECTSTLSYADNVPSIIMFADMYDNFIPWGNPNNEDVYSSGNVLNMTGRAIAIPPGAKYAYIGFDIRRGGGFATGTYTVRSTMTYEFM